MPCTAIAMPQGKKTNRASPQKSTAVTTNHDSVVFESTEDFEHSQDFMDGEEVEDDFIHQEENVAMGAEVIYLQATPPNGAKQASTSSNSDDLFNSASQDEYSTGPYGFYGAHKKNKLTRVTLSPDDEIRVVEWLRKNPMLYDRNRKNYKDVDKKCAMYERLAKTLNPPLKGQQLRIWVDGMRTRYGRLTSQGTGSTLPKRTEREQWIWETFSFFATHIVRSKTKSTHTFQEMQSQALNVPEEDPINTMDEGRPSSSNSADIQQAKRQRIGHESDRDDMKRVMECMVKVASAMERLSSNTGPDPNRPNAQVANFCDFMYHSLVKLRPDICNATMRACTLELFKANDQQLNLSQPSAMQQQQQQEPPQQRRQAFFKPVP